MCPCGSGKKLKFCCQSVGAELDRAADLEERRQFDKAIAHLETVLQKGVREPSARTGVRLRLAIDLLRRESAGGAEVDLQKLRELVGDMITDTPDHLEVLGIDALLDLRERGYPGSQKTFSTLLQKTGDHESPCVSSAIIRLASELLSSGHTLAGMHFLRKGVMLTPAPGREAPYKDLLGLLQNVDILAPLRVNYRLMAPANRAKHQSAFDAAQKLFGDACFSDAAKALIPIVRDEPTDGAIWWNMGVCHACAAEEPLAVRAFTAGSGNFADPEAAADCLVMARLLDKPSEEEQVESVAQLFKVEMLSRLLSRLDTVPRLVRLPSAHDHDHDEDGRCANDEPSSTSYLVLDRPMSEVPAGATAAEFASVLGSLDLVSGDPTDGSHAVASLRCHGRETFQSVLAHLLENAGTDLIAMEEPRSLGGEFPEQALFDQANWFPQTQTMAQDVAASRAAAALQIERWFDQPQSLLQGKSPRNAAGVPELQIPLRAAVTLLELFAQRRRQIVDADSVRARLGLPAIPRNAPTFEELRDRGTIFSLRRLNAAAISRDALLPAIYELASINTPWGIPLMQQAVRQQLLPDAESRGHLESSLTTMLERHQEFGLCAETIREIIELSRKRKSSLQSVAVWEIKLMLQLALLGQADELQQVADRVWTYYLPKLPELRTVILAALRQLMPEGPWQSSDTPAQLAGATTAGGIWTPGVEPAAPAGKLWLPGT